MGAADYDNDGWPDIFVANDGLERVSLPQRAQRHVQGMGLPAGMAFAAQGQTMAAMCISLGDYDNDGWLDLYISDFQKTPITFGTTTAKDTSTK